MAEIKLSEDGSHTLFVPELDEHYHSTHGAIQESMHVFINAGFNRKKAQELSVLEFGFGTGLNALLTFINKGDAKILYHTLEKYPIDTNLADHLNYKHVDGDLYADFFTQLHSCAWGQDVILNKDFVLRKEHVDFKDVILTEDAYDIVYFDAFAPDKQPGLWSEEIFEKVYAAIKAGGILTTYCAKGVVRRTMQEVGFKVERIPGPPGKREMLRAIK